MNNFMPPIFNKEHFLENLLLDESRDAYAQMTLEQQKVVRLAYLYGYLINKDTSK